MDSVYNCKSYTVCYVLKFVFFDTPTNKVTYVNC